MRRTYIKGDITKENIEIAINAMLTASAYAVNVTSSNKATADTAIVGITDNISVVEKTLMEDNQWEVECSAGTFYFTI